MRQVRKLGVWELAEPLKASPSLNKLYSTPAITHVSVHSRSAQRLLYLYLTNGFILKPVIKVLAGSNGKSEIVIKSRLHWWT